VDLIPPLHEVYGWAAAVLTLLAFSCNGIVRLRYVALSANAAFMAYGLTAELWPVFFLHAVLVPVNLWRLTQALHPSLRLKAETSVRNVASATVEPDTHDR
jgi:CRP/FNR family cyclic AMP-dependent transcriptional regulator